MLSELDELYQQVILDHGRKPRNFRAMDEADGSAEGYNPLCGDRVMVYVRRTNGRIAEVTFTGRGCAICTASASMMTQQVAGCTTEQILAIFERFHDMVTGDPLAAEQVEAMGKLAVFAGVRKYPIRVKCATLPWHTVKAALEDRSDQVSTE